MMMLWSYRFFLLYAASSYWGCSAFAPTIPTASRSRTSNSRKALKALPPPISDRRSFVSGSVVGSGVVAATFLNGAAPKPVLAADNISNGRVDGVVGGLPTIVLWGYGNQNQLMAKYLYERKYPVVAVVSHHNIGEDYGMVESSDWGSIGVETGVRITGEENAQQTLTALKPDLCLLCTRSTIQDIQPALTVCANAKVNVITIAEELLDSSTSSPRFTKELDELFKANGVSFTGSGFIDGACCEMTMAMSSMMQRIDGLEGSLRYNVDDYGKVLAAAHGVGLSRDQFQKDIVKKQQAKSYVYNSNEWFVRALGLTLVKTTEVREPIFAKTDVKSKSIGRSIPAGDCTGMKVIATTATREGVTIMSEQIGKCYEEGDEDSVTWGFKGEPAGVQFTMKNPPTPQMTCTATISRIPQLIAAEPGYITTYMLPIATYKYIA